MKGNQSIFQKGRLATAVASVFALGISISVQAEMKTMELEVKEQALATALLEIGLEAGIEIVIPQGITGEQSMVALSGNYTLSQALDKLLAGSGLSYKFTSETTVVVEDKTDTENDIQKEAEEGDDVDEEVVVTGSRITRTPSQMADNLLVLDGDELRASGESTLEGALRTLPQNMYGASPVGATVDGAVSVNGAINITAASTINLRGLGDRSTLILVDGRRIGKSGVFGGVSDITGIPLRAVERVEILLDGASSIYGSDAVGGVVNIIMKKDYEGYTDITHRYSTPEQGGYEEHVFTATSGFRWDSGQLRATYQHFQNSNLDGEERPESIGHSPYHSPASVGLLTAFIYQGQRYFPLDLNAELGAPAGSNWTWALRNYRNYPGVTREISHIFIPDNQDGSNLSAEDFIYYAVDTLQQANELAINSDASEGISLLPPRTRDGLNVSFDQELNVWGNEVLLSGSVYYSERQVYAANGGFTFGARLPAEHPLNVFQQPFTTAWYVPSLGAEHYETDTQTVRWNFSLDGRVGETWNWRANIGQSRGKIDSNFFNESIGSSDAALLIDEGLNIFASDIVAANSPELLSRLVIPESPTSVVNEENTLAADANGSLLSLPGGDVYLAFGAEWRQNKLDTESSRDIAQGTVFGGNSTPQGAFSASEGETLRAGFVELVIPVVGADNRMAGIEQLSLTGSARYESYPNRQDSSSTWALGLVWRPVDQVVLRAKHSTSYVVPTFAQRLIERVDVVYSTPIALIIRDEENQIVGFDFAGTYIRGGNPDLKPETASTQSVGLTYTPDILPGLTATVSWSETESKDRIDAPYTNLYSYVDYVALYPNISRDEQGLLVMDRRAVNIGALERSGMDYRLAYNRSTDFGQFNASLNVAHTTKYNEMPAPGTPSIDQLGDVDFFSRAVIQPYRYSAHLGWRYRGLSIDMTANTHSKTVSTAAVQVTVNPALHANLTMGYDFEQGDLFAVPDWMQNTTLMLTVNNLLDDYDETSVIDLTTGEPYIYSSLNTNTDPRGRLFSLSLTKSF